MAFGFDFLIEQCSLFLGSGTAVPVALFLAGLAGGFSHCAGMCGPFVLAQVPTGGRGPLERLKGAALMPYHLGRMVTYALLGALAGSLSGLVPDTSFQRHLAAFLLLAAGMLFLLNLAPALKTHMPRTGLAARVGGAIGGLARSFMLDGRAQSRFMLGILLGFLPCGLLMAALMAAAATGKPWLAAASMAAFAAGTMPALVLVGAGGQLLRQRWPLQVRAAMRGLLAFNACLLFFIAGGMIL